MEPTGRGPDGQPGGEEGGCRQRGKKNGESTIIFDNNSWLSVNSEDNANWRRPFFFHSCLSPFEVKT